MEGELMKNEEITVIKLLNKISKNKTVPKQIRYENTIYNFDSENKTYYDENYETLFSMYNFKILNEKVEILPEKNDEWEDIEEIDFLDKFEDSYYDTCLIKMGKICNQLIKNQKYLKEKLDKDE